METFMDIGGRTVAENEKDLLEDAEGQTADEAEKATLSEPQLTENDDQPETAEEEALEVTILSLSDVQAQAELPKEESKPPVIRIDSSFEAPDVSEPQTPRRVSEIREEEKAFRRQSWIKTHLTHIFVVIGIVIVALTALLILMYYRSTNPLSRFSAAVTKDFGTSFDFDVQLTQKDKTVMRYQGSVDSDRSAHEINVLYQADYGSYQYTGAVLTADGKSMRGSYYKDQWTVYDCTERVQDFYDFDRSFSSGRFNSGAFLRFTGLTADYEAKEFESFVNTLMNRMTTNSPIATITSSRSDDGTHYDYRINPGELFEMVKKDGASIFHRSSDYDKFLSTYEENAQLLETAKCDLNYTIDNAGYLSALDLTVRDGEDVYGMSCRMSNFASAEVSLPEGFVKTAALALAQE